MGSSIGITKVAEEGNLDEAIERAFRYDDYVLVEKGIDARELEVSVMGWLNPRASLPGEIVPDDTFYSYEAKYISEGSQLLIPAPISDETVQQIRDLACRAYTSLHLEGMARLDFLMERDSGELWINEPNTIPGFTHISMYPKLWEATGVPYSELLDQLISSALDRRKRRSAISTDRG
jgi:D-alanine-D-alanine ligase